MIPPDETPEIQPTPLWRITGATIIAILAIVVIFWLVISTEDNTRAARKDQQGILQILAQIDKYTNPHSRTVQAEQKAQMKVVDHIIVCVENHQDRVTASILHVTPPPPLKGCPAAVTQAFTPPSPPKPTPVASTVLTAASPAIHAQVPASTSTTLPGRGKHKGHR